jgi:hypothetical protein
VKIRSDRLMRLSLAQTNFTRQRCNLALKVCFYSHLQILDLEKVCGYDRLE